MNQAVRETSNDRLRPVCKKLRQHNLSLLSHCTHCLFATLCIDLSSSRRGCRCYSSHQIKRKEGSWYTSEILYCNSWWQRQWKGNQETRWWWRRNHNRRSTRLSSSLSLSPSYPSRLASLLIKIINDNNRTEEKMQRKLSSQFSALISFEFSCTVVILKRGGRWTGQNSCLLLLAWCFFSFSHLLLLLILVACYIPVVVHFTLLLYRKIIGFRGRHQEKWREK